LTGASSGEGDEEGAHFLLGLGRIGEGLADFLAQKLAVTAAQPMHGHVDNSSSATSAWGVDRAPAASTTIQRVVAR